MTAGTFKTSIAAIDLRMRKGRSIKPLRWQSIDVSKRPEAEMIEVTNVKFDALMRNEDLDYYRDQIKPNIPWADRHFELERVSGHPINPGITWREWPGGNSAAAFIEDGVFSHSYAERYWPKLANVPPEQLPAEHTGIRYRYGDLMDVVRLLHADPHTRQAWLPVWFPEDTGVVHGKRVPCTLGYHFMMRKELLNVFYPIRSCDYANHFRDDLYLTVRLVLWMLTELRKLDESWRLVDPGIFTFWAGSVHMFINQWNHRYANNQR